MAVAFLGYYDSFGAFSSAPSFIRLSRAFPQIVEAAQVEAGVGRELYLVIPRDPQAVISVREAEASAADESGLLHRGDPGMPVLVHNNFFGPDTRVSCTDPSGQEVSLVPQVDPASGGVVCPAGVRDVSLPLPAPLEGLTACDYGTDFDGRDLGIRLRLESGRPVLTVRPEPLALLGFDAAEFSLLDGDNEFAGVNGLCKGVFLGTIGQDYNPVACVVMENGELKICTVFFAVQHGGPELSDALPEFKDVVSLESGVMPEPGEDGEPMPEYETIYALDARGGRIEVPHFQDYGLFVASDGDATVEAELTPDWQFRLSRYGEDGLLDEVCEGSFSELERGDGLDRFRFRLNRLARREGEDYKVDERTRKGRFTAREIGLSYEVTLSGADFFKSGTEFRDARLVGAEEEIEYD